MTGMFVPLINDTIHIIIIELIYVEVYFVNLSIKKGKKNHTISNTVVCRSVRIFQNYVRFHNLNKCCGKWYPETTACLVYYYW